MLLNGCTSKQMLFVDKLAISGFGKEAEGEMFRVFVVDALYQWSDYWCAMQACSARDATAKCLYGALFDWIVLQINTTLLSKHGSRPHKASLLPSLFDVTFLSYQFCVL